MILVCLIVIPILGGMLSWAAGRKNPLWPRWAALVTLVLEGALCIVLWGAHGRDIVSGGRQGWFHEVHWLWFPELGIHFHLAADGISILLLVLTAVVGIMAVLASWTEIRQRAGFFFFNLLLTLAGIAGVFLALDLFLFYFFWELMLVPMFLLIALWGHERRRQAAVKFFIFTQMGGLFMLVAIIGLVLAHSRAMGFYSFDYMDLRHTPLNPATATLLCAGFLLAFLVKLPAIPLHTWLPDAHTEAPTGGSVILAGLLLKTGAYGLIRFGVPLFPDAASHLAPAGMVLGVIGILYGAFLVFAQTDLKRLIAYTSVSHMGFVLLGVAAWNETAIQGVIVQMVCHGISTGALFMLAGALQERTATRQIDRMGGLWVQAPRMGGVWLFFGLASLGLPGLGNFIGEFLVLLGVYRESAAAAAFGAGGFVLAVVYALWMIWRVFWGEARWKEQVPDLSAREMAVMAVLIAIIVWIGFFPQPLMDAARHGFHHFGKAPPARLVGVIKGTEMDAKWGLGRNDREGHTPNDSGGQL